VQLFWGQGNTELSALGCFSGTRRSQGSSDLQGLSGKSADTPAGDSVSAAYCFCQANFRGCEEVGEGLLTVRHNGNSNRGWTRHRCSWRHFGELCRLFCVLMYTRYVITIE
jgi:hypothetical protein